MARWECHKTAVVRGIYRGQLIYDLYTTKKKLINFKVHNLNFTLIFNN